MSGPDLTEAPDSIPMDAANLIAQIVSANVTNLAATTDRIIEALTDRAQDAEATLAAVRTGIVRLIDGDYAPTTAALERALWPSEDCVAVYRERLKDLG